MLKWTHTKQITDTELAQLSDSPTFIRMLENKVRIELSVSPGILRSSNTSAREQLYKIVTETFESISEPQSGLLHVSSATTNGDGYAKLTAMFSTESDRNLFEDALTETKLKNPV